jgi:hypothetical protein
MVFVKRNCLPPGDKAGEFHLVPAIPSVLRHSMDFAPRPGVGGTTQHLGSVNPYLCPISGARAYRVESSTGRRLVIVLPKFDGRGGGAPS